MDTCTIYDLVCALSEIIYGILSEIRGAWLVGAWLEFAVGSSKQQGLSQIRVHCEKT